MSNDRRYNLTEIPPYVSGPDLPLRRAGRYDMAAIAAAHPGMAVWSGVDPVPLVGDRVFVEMNDFGAATVTGYFVEYGFLGVHVRPDQRPPWHREQHPHRDVILVFGIEIRRIK